MASATGHGVLMDSASETDAMLQGLTEEASPPQAPDSLADPAIPAVELAAETGKDLPASAEPAIVQVQEPVEDGEQLTSVAASKAVASAAETMQDSTPAHTAADSSAQVEQLGLAAPIESAELQLAPDHQPEQPHAISVSDTLTNGVADTNNKAGTNEVAAAAHAAPERGRSRKRRARWGAPANAPAEPAADAAADGEQTGRKKRRSRWEESAPVAEESQQLAIVDMSAGSGFPHEIVLAGGIKVKQSTTVPLI